MGGGRAIAWTDTLQFLLFMTGATSALAYIVTHVPGEFSGEIAMISGQRALVRGRVGESGEFLEIEDEGKGFPPAMLDVNSDDLPSAFGVGLRGMNERMRELGGSLELKPTKQGAIVRAIVPRKQTHPEIEQQNTTAEERSSAA